MIGKINTALRHVPAWPLYFIGSVPAAIYIYLALTNRLGADPVKRLEHEFGEFALQILIIVLLVTPLRNMFGLNLLKFRRALGLLAFGYVILHFLTYLGLDQQFYWPEIWQDITKRPYIIVGVMAFVAMIPLAVTSNNLSVRRLGAQAWRRLHRLTYFIAIAGAVHFLLLVKAWPPEPFVYLFIMLTLVGYRVARVRRRKRSVV